MDDYTKSNKITEFPKTKLSKETKKMFLLLRSKSNLLESDMEMLCHMLSKDLKIDSIKSLQYSGTEPHSVNGSRLENKTLGKYNPNNNKIILYKFTARRKQLRATKSVLDTLLHEYVHHLDYVLLRLERSLHTAGFYKRISWLKNELIN